MHAAQGPLPRAARRAAGHPRASSWRARSSRCGPGVQRFEPGDRVMSIVAGGGQAELAVVHERTAMPVPEELDWDGRRRRARGLHHRPRRALHPGGAARRRAPARPRRRGRRRHGRRPARPDGRRARDRDGPQPRAAASASTRSTSRRSSPRASRSTARSTSCSSSSARPNMPGNVDALATGGRIVVIGIGAGAKAELDLRAADGQARDASTRRRCAPARSRTRPPPPAASSARCCPASPPATSACRSARPTRSTTSPHAYERFQAGGKLGKIVLLP